LKKLLKRNAIAIIQNATDANDCELIDPETLPKDTVVKDKHNDEFVLLSKKDSLRIAKS